MILMKIAHMDLSEADLALELMVLFGSVSYGDKNGMISENFKWSQATGKDILTKDEFLSKLVELGFTKSKANKLYAEIEDQHSGSSRESSKFNNKPDFSHMMITGATELSNSPQLLANIRAGGKTVKAAGWLGDISTIAGKPSIGNDDYKADLDAVNIIYRIKHGRGAFNDVLRQYYNELDSGVTNRAKEFQRHYKLKEIIKDINIADGSGKQVGVRDIMGGKEVIIEYDYSLKETLNKDAQKFVNSLEKNSNEYIDEELN